MLLGVPATEVANELGKIVVANMVMLAAVNAHRRIVGDEALWEAVKETAGTQWVHLSDFPPQKKTPQKINKWGGWLWGGGGGGRG